MWWSWAMRVDWETKEILLNFHVIFLFYIVKVLNINFGDDLTNGSKIGNMWSIQVVFITSWIWKYFWSIFGIGIMFLTLFSALQLPPCQMSCEAESRGARPRQVGKCLRSSNHHNIIVKEWVWNISGPLLIHSNTILILWLEKNRARMKTWSHSGSLICLDMHISAVIATVQQK